MCFEVDGFGEDPFAVYTSFGMRERNSCDEDERKTDNERRTGEIVLEPRLKWRKPTPKSVAVPRGSVANPWMLRARATVLTRLYAVGTVAERRELRTYNNILYHKW